MDIGFIRRVYRTSVGVWLFALLWCAALKAASAAIGITIGFAISLGSLVLLERLVRTVFAPRTEESRGPIKRLIAIAIVKYAIIGVVLWGALKSGWASPAGLAIGIGLPQAVIFLKGLGIALTPGRQSRTGL